MQDRGSKERKKPKTAPYKGKRLHCARCKKRSPRKVLTPAPWYCPQCLAERDDAMLVREASQRLNPR